MMIGRQENPGMKLISQSGYLIFSLEQFWEEFVQAAAAAGGEIKKISIIRNDNIPLCSFIVMSVCWLI